MGTFLERIPLDVLRELEKYQESIVGVHVTSRKNGWDVAIDIRGYMEANFFIFVSELNILMDFINKRTNYIGEYISKYPSVRRTRTGSWFVSSDNAYFSFTIPSELANIIERVLRRIIS